MTDRSRTVSRRRDMREAMHHGLARRRRRDWLVRRLGVAAIGLGLGFLALMSASLIGLGYSAFWQTRIQPEAADTTEAETLLHTRRPNLILLDWMLPEESDIELLHRLRRDRERRDIPVISSPPWPGRSRR